VHTPWAGFDVGVHATGAGVRPFPTNSYRFLSNRRISPEKGGIALLSRGLIAICDEQTGKHFE
jgi:hypothetical protein